MLGIHHLQFEVEAGKEPDDDGRKEDDGACLADKGFQTIPHMNQYALDAWKMVSRQLHNKGSRITGKEGGLFEDDTRNDDGSNADKVSGGSNPAGAVKQRTGNQSDDGKLCRTGDKGGGHNGHLAVAVIFDGTACLNRRNATA